MKFKVTLDVTFSGDVEIEANDEKEACKIIRDMSFNTLDKLKGFYFINKDVFQVRQV